MSFVGFKRDALFGSEMWQLENKGEEQKLAIICGVGREREMKTMQMRERNWCPRFPSDAGVLSLLHRFRGPS